MERYFLSHRRRTHKLAGRLCDVFKCSFFLWSGVSGYLKMLELFVAKFENWNKSKNTWKARSLWKSSQGHKQAFVLLSRWNLCARFLFFSLFVPFRGWKLDLCSKLMSCLYGLIFCFSLPLFISSSTLLFFQICFVPRCVLPLLPNSNFSPPLASISFIQLLSRVRPIRLVVLWGELSPQRGLLRARSAPPLPGAAAGLRD